MSDATTETCACGNPLGPGAQDGLPGLGVAAKCRQCARVQHILRMLPASSDERPSVPLDKFEEDFLPSIRARVAEGRPLTERQMDALERLYRRIN